jgi:hypothetical protein
VSFSHADPEVTIYNGPLFSEIFQEWIVENLSDDLELSSDSDDITIPNKRPILSDELSDDVEDIDKVIEDIDDEISYNPDCDIIRRIQVRSDSRIRNMGSSINLSLRSLMFSFSFFISTLSTIIPPLALLFLLDFSILQIFSMRNFS